MRTSIIVSYIAIFALGTLLFFSSDASHHAAQIALNHHPQPVSTDVQHDVQAIVLRVIDGDSLLVTIPSFPPLVGQKITVRIARCDTPEQRDKNPNVRLKALEAKRMTEKLASPGSVVWLRDLQRDKYFRILSRVESQGIDVGNALIEAGLAVPYSGGKKKTSKEWNVLLAVE